MSQSRKVFVLIPGSVPRTAIEEVLRCPSDIQLMEKSEEEYKTLLEKELYFAREDENKHKTICATKKNARIQNYTEFLNDLKSQYPESKLIKHISGVFKARNSPESRAAMLDFSILQQISLEFEKMKTQRARQNSQTYGGSGNSRERQQADNFYRTVNPLPQGTNRNERPVLLSSEILPDKPVNINGRILYPSEMYNQLEHRSAEQVKDISFLQKELKEARDHVDELRNRLSGFASKQLTQGNPDFTDLSDKNRPTKIAERFHNIYDEEWTTALENLTHAKKGSESTTEEQAIKMLMEIIKRVNAFCVNHALQQEQNIKVLWNQCVDNPFATYISVDLKSQNPTVVPPVVLSEFKSQRKAYNKECLKNVIKECKTKTLTGLLKKENPAVEVYADRCTEALWLMAIQDPPMVISWPSEGSNFDHSTFKEYCRKGTVVKLPVWPAVHLHKDGALVSKGYAMPI